MAWPASDIPTTNLDAGTDNPQTARADLLSLAQAVNLLRNHFSTFMRGLAEAVDAPAARTALGAASAAATVNLTGAQTVAGLKTFSSGVLSTSTSQAMGYGPGVRSSVVQTVAKTNTVILNTPCGEITTHAAALAAGASVTFTLFNSSFATGAELISVCIDSTPLISYSVRAGVVRPGRCDVVLKNETTGSLSDAVGISFAIIAR